MTPRPVWFYTSPGLICWATPINELQEVWCGGLQEKDGGEVVTGYWEWGIPSSVLLSSGQDRWVHTLWDGLVFCVGFFFFFKSQGLVRKKAFSFQESELIFVPCSVSGIPPLGLISSPPCKDEKRVAFSTIPAIWKTRSISCLPINSPSVLKSHVEMHPWSFTSTF